MDYTQYEIELERVNKEYLEKFTKWLRVKKLSDKTIKNHVDNVDLYINDFLNYYDVHEMRYGCGANIDSFLGDWFIRKCLW